MIKYYCVLIMVLLFGHLSAQEIISEETMNKDVLNRTVNCNVDFCENKKSFKVYLNTEHSENSPDLDSMITDNWNSGKSSWEFKSKMEFHYDTLYRSTSEISYLWNSAGNNWLENTKTDYEYDSYNNRTGYANYSWYPATSEWIGTERIRNTFDSSGTILLFENFAWSPGYKDWVVVNNVESILDSTGNVTSQIYSDINSGLKQKTNEFDYKYDSLGNRISEIQSLFYLGQENPLPYSRTESAYDLAGHIVWNVYSEWNINDSLWTYIKSEENYYNAAGIRDSAIIRFWDATLGDWNKYLKYEFLYDENGNIILSSTCSWSDDTNFWNCYENVEYNFNWDNQLINKTAGGWDYSGHWYGKNKEDYEYGSEGKIALKIQYEWDQIANDWVSSFKTIYNYDSLGNNILYSRYHWDIPTGKYVPSTQYVDSFNNKYLIEDLVLPNSIADLKPDYHSMPVQEIVAYKSGSEFAPYKRISYYFLPKEEIDTTSTEPSSTFLSSDALSVYPNPGKDYIKVRLNEPAGNAHLQLYNLNGIMVENRILNSNEPLDVRNLNRGLYFVKIVYRNKSFPGKIVLE
jgi:hypothetical protein